MLCSGGLRKWIRSLARQPSDKSQKPNFLAGIQDPLCPCPIPYPSLSSSFQIGAFGPRRWSTLRPLLSQVPSHPRNAPTPGPSHRRPRPPQAPLPCAFSSRTALTLSSTHADPNQGHPSPTFPGSVLLSHQRGQRRGGSLGIVQWFSNCAPRPSPRSHCGRW